MKSATGKDDGLLSSFWRHRVLILALTRRDIAGRYRGSMLGVMWSLLTPLLMLAVYTFVFTEVFGLRWAGAVTSNRFEFSLQLFAGLLVFSLFSECAVRAPGLIVGNANYVKKVVFPLQIYAWVALGTALFHFAVGLVVLLGATLLIKGAVPATALLLPLPLLPFLLFCAGLTWFLSALGVYLRDIGQIIGVIVSALMFLSPVFFPSSAMPQAYRPLLMVNPLTFPIEQVRDVLVWGRGPDWTGLVAYLTLSVVVAMAGLWWFNRTRRGFADVI